MKVLFFSVFYLVAVQPPGGCGEIIFVAKKSQSG